VPRSVAEPLRTNEVNATGTLNMLLAARDAGVRRFVFAASSAAYGDSERLPKSEDMPPSPLSPYAHRRSPARCMAGCFTRCTGWKPWRCGISTCSARGRTRIRICRRNTEIYPGRYGRPAAVVFGNGEQSRDFTYVQNVVDANLLACSAGPDAAGEVINVACGERITLNELAGAIQDALGKQVGVDYAAPRPGDIKHSLADIAKARRLLGYNPEVSFARDWNRRWRGTQHVR